MIGIEDSLIKCKIPITIILILMRDSYFTYNCYVKYKIV